MPDDPTTEPTTDHEAEPLEEVTEEVTEEVEKVPVWAQSLIDSNKTLTQRLDAMSKPTTKPVTKKPATVAPRDTNGNPATTETTTQELPEVVVAPKRPTFLSRMPRWF